MAPRGGGSSTRRPPTDGEGRFRFRLPPGETDVPVMGLPPGYARLAGGGSSRTAEVPDGPARFEFPPIELEAAALVRGRLLDAAGAPVAGAVVLGRFLGPMKGFLFHFGAGGMLITDADGGFLMPPAAGNLSPVGPGERVLIRLPDGAGREATVFSVGGDMVTARLAP